jgi:hypothetical protein
MAPERSAGTAGTGGGRWQKQAFESATARQDAALPIGWGPTGKSECCSFIAESTGDQY